MAITAYTDAGTNKFCWWVVDGDSTIDRGSMDAIGPPMYLEALALAYVLERLGAAGIRGVVQWVTDAEPVVRMLRGLARPRTPTMQWLISQITWKAHRYGIRIVPTYCSYCFDC